MKFTLILYDAIAYRLTTEVVSLETLHRAYRAMLYLESRLHRQTSAIA